MNEPISHNTLCGYLSLLRNIVTEESNYPPPHVIFFDNRSFYHYFSGCSCGQDTVEVILEKMEACIPLAFTTQSIDLFLSACESTETYNRTTSFMESSKADFLLLLNHAANDDECWLCVAQLCENLRQQNQ